MRTYLYLTYRCNCNCFFCASDETNVITSKNEVSYDEAKKFLINSPDKKHLTISGGEPTIHRDFLRIVRFAKEYYEHITLLTNGIRFADMAFLKEALNSGVDRIAIPFYSPIESEHNAMVGNSTSFNSLIRCLSNINSLQPNDSFQVLVKLLLAKFTYKTIPESIDYLAQNYPNLKRLSLNGLHIGSKALSRSFESVINYDDARPYNDLAIKKLIDYRFHFQLCEIPLCAFSREIVELLLAQNKIACVDNAFLKRPDKESMITPFSSVFIPNECHSCALAHLCPKIYGKNASSFTFGVNPF